MSVTSMTLIPIAVLRKQEWARKRLTDGLGPRKKGFLTTHRNPCELDISPVRMLVDDPQDYDKVLARAEKRSIAQKNARVAVREDVLKQIDAMEIHIPLLDSHELLCAAIESYNNGPIAVSRCGVFYLASTNCAEAFLQRCQVNYIRHELTDYDQVLKSIASRPGARRARTRLRKKVHRAISELYPHLALECRRQSGASKKKLAALAAQQNQTMRSSGLR